MATPGAAEFEHRRGWYAFGQISGACDAVAMDDQARPALHRLQTGASTLTLTHVWTNYTLVAQAGTETRRMLDRHEVAETYPIAPGWVEIGESGTGRVVPWGPVLGRLEWFNLSFSAIQARTGWVHDGGTVDGAPPPWLDLDPAPVPPVIKWRRMELRDLEFRITGAVELFLQDVTVAGRDNLFRIPPNQVQHEPVAPGVEVVREERFEGRLSSTNVVWEERAPTAVAYCERLSSSLNGRFDVHDVDGSIHWPPNDRAVEAASIAFEGAFELTDTPSYAPDSQRLGAVAATLRGDFKKVLVDGSSLAVRPSEPLTLPGEAWYLVAGLVAGCAVAGVLYTRLHGREVFRRGERRALLEVITSFPMITITELQRRVMTSSSNLRYHLGILEREGYARGVRVRGRYHYVPVGHDVEDARRRILLEEDPKLRTLVDGLRTGEARATLVVRRLQEQYGISRAGGWRILGRAVRARLVERRRKSRGVVLRASP